MITKENVIGIIGGMGPRAGADLLQSVISHTPAGSDQEHLPTILMAFPGDVVDRTAFLEGRTKINPAYSIVRIIKNIESAGAKFVGIACNTSYCPAIYDVVIEQLEEQGSKVSMLNMPLETCRYIRQNFPCVRRIGVMTTNGTYGAGLYTDLLKDFGYEAIIPDEHFQQEVIHKMIYHPRYGLKAHPQNIRAEVRDLMKQSLDYFNEFQAEVVLLGCTELSVFQSESENTKMSFVDSTEALAAALVREATQSEESSAAGECYEPASEQIQNWNYHSKLPLGRRPEVITISVNLPHPDFSAIEKAIATLIRRHESLRTYFPVINGDVKQCVLPYDEDLFRPVYHQLEGVDEDAVINSVTEKNKMRVKELILPPLLNSTIFKKADNSCYVSIIVHHIISDEWSKGIMLRELSLYYEMYRTGKQLPVAPLKMQLREYAAWQISWQKENMTGIRKYWSRKLSDLRGENFVWPSDGTFSHPKSIDEVVDCLDNGEAASFNCRIDSELHQRLLRLAAVTRTSIGTIINASLQLLFQLLTGKEKVLVATPVITRYLPGTETLIGCLGGGIYLYKSAGSHLTIGDFLQSVYVDFLEASQHLIYNHDEVGVDGKLLRLHCDVFVNFLSRGIIGDGDMGTRGQMGHRELSGKEYYALTLSGSEYRDGLLCDWKYNKTIYKPKMIELMAKMHKSILSFMSRDSSTPIYELAEKITNKYSYGKYSEEDTSHL